MTEYKTIPIEKRTTQNWHDAIDDAHRMLALAKQNPDVLDVEGWTLEIQRRIKQATEYFPETVWQ